jgi:hypothetical protein
VTLADEVRQKSRKKGRAFSTESQSFRTAVIRSFEIRHGDCHEGTREALERMQDPGGLKHLYEIASPGRLKI